MSAAAGLVADLVSAASAHAARGEQQAALDALAAAGAIDPGSLPLQFALAMLAWQMGDPPKALHLLRLCAEQAPMNGTVAEALASLHAQTGNLVESVYQGKLATALDADPALRPLVPPEFPSFDSAFRAFRKQPLLASARQLAGAGRWREALAQARQHLDIAPEDLDGRHFYVDALLRTGSAGAAAEAAAAWQGAALPPETASLHARVLTAVGEFDQARQWHDRACAAAPGDAAIAAARAVDSVWFGAPGEARERARAWTESFIRASGARRHRPVQGKLVIGYLVSGLADREDAAAVGHVARAHDRAATMVIGYGAGGALWAENGRLSGAFDRWCDVGALDPATLARSWANDGVDVLIDAGGLAGAVNLQALAAAAPIRVAWLGAAAGLGASLYDAAIVGPSAVTGSDGAMQAWRMPCGAYPLATPEAMPVRPAHAGGCRFGADVALHQLGPDTVALWSALLRANPGAVLILRDNDLRSPASIDRLVARFGRELASHIDIIAASERRDFYGQIDVALAPLRGVSARLAAEPLAHSVPVVAAATEESGAGAALLQDLGLGSLLVGDTAEAYVAKASALARAEPRAAAVDEVRRAALRGSAIAGEIAAGIERAARTLLAEAAA